MRIGEHDLLNVFRARDGRLAEYARNGPGAWFQSDDPAVFLFAAVEIEVAAQTRDVEREERHEDVGDETNCRLFASGDSLHRTAFIGLRHPFAGEHHDRIERLARVPVHAERSRTKMNSPVRDERSRDFAQVPAVRELALQYLRFRAISPPAATTPRAAGASSVTGCANGSSGGAPNEVLHEQQGQHTGAQDSVSWQKAQAFEQDGR